MTSGKRGARRRVSRRRTPLWAKILTGFGSLLMVASAGTIAFAEVMLDKVNDSVDTQCLLDDCEAYEPGEEIKGPLNMLMIGSDMRKDWSSAQSDSIMILHINADLTAAEIVSIPRDLWVEIPNCGPNWGNNPCSNKINAAFAAGGTDTAASVSSLAATLTQLTGVTFDGAAMVNFGGFEEVVKLLGGVELCVPFDMTLAHPKGHKVKKGCKEYDPEIALGIVRERYSYDPSTPGWKPEYGIGDYGRQRMQQHFIKQLLKKAKEEGYVTDPLKVGTLIEKIGSQLLLDLKGRQVTDFAYALRNIDAGNITTLKVPSEPAPAPTDPNISAVVIQPGEQQQAAEELFEGIVNDSLNQWIVSHPEWVNKGN